MVLLSINPKRYKPWLNVFATYRNLLTGECTDGFVKAKPHKPWLNVFVACRNLLNGEYTQMAVRAGRRVVDF